jgi:hypothetical protein
LDTSSNFNPANLLDISSNFNPANLLDISSNFNPANLLDISSNFNPANFNPTNLATNFVASKLFGNASEPENENVVVENYDAYAHDTLNRLLQMETNYYFFKDKIKEHLTKIIHDGDINEEIKANVSEKIKKYMNELFDENKINISQSNNFPDFMFKTFLKDNEFSKLINSIYNNNKNKKITNDNEIINIIKNNMTETKNEKKIGGKGGKKTNKNKIKSKKQNKTRKFFIV